MNASRRTRAARRSPRSARASRVGDPRGLLDRFELDLDGWKRRLEQDESPQTSEDAIHHLVALVSSLNLGVASGTASAGPSGAQGPRGARAPDASPEGASPVTTDLSERLETIVATLHRLVAQAASRIGATGYSLGVSFPAGVSLSVEFALPKPPGPSGPQVRPARDTTDKSTPPG